MPQCMHTHGPSRRMFLCCSASATFSALIGTLLSSSSVAKAEPLAGDVPTVDRVALRVVTDSYQLAIAPSGRTGNVEVTRFGMPPAGKSLLGEFGLSMHVESNGNGETRNMLIDFGFTSETLENNLSMLGIAPERLDALVLSHGHYDHFGGLAGFLQHNQRRLRPGLPLYLGGEEAFCTREWTAGKIEDFGAIDRRALTAARIKVFSTEAPSIIADHGFTTGRIPTASFEQVMSPSRMHVGTKDGIGCFPDKLATEKQSVQVIPDDFQHELATCFNVKGRGLVVITSCSHRGVINTVRRAMEVSGVQKVHAVAGGFHLAPQKEEYVRQTVAALRDVDPDYIIPMHCSGETFAQILQKEMPDRFIRSYTGSRYVFGA
ncbi:MBL fold metallo-hydrolase [Burkholderia sp. THE68]|uniref:MBL fold metallo-hydrolase n=1 Tax=Burkholderia sp. THE68 TaxID=758782 RepID=UPI0013166FC3|nr:MBL fold metallo-hydrolase [Burkholderia sp. THE68]BBU31072.1 MBL fold metallo-hydrolase [Burkholderia sp. THE68]